MKFGAIVSAMVVAMSFDAIGEARATWTLFNPTGLEYRNELVRLKVDVPAGFGPAEWSVLEDGQPVPFQVETIGEKPAIWVAVNLAQNQKRTYTLDRKPAVAMPARVKARRDGEALVLENELTGVRLPAAWRAGAPVPAPVQAVRLPEGQWVGQGHWRSERRLVSFEAKIVAEGPLFAKARLEYRFEGTAGIEPVPAFYRAEVTLPPDRRHAIVEESFEMPRGSYWEFDAARGWAPRQAVTIPHFGDTGRPTILDKSGQPYPFPPVSLQNSQTRMGDTLLNLVPRWSQAYDDGWFFMTHDGQNGVGTLVCRASRWLWPYDGMIEIKVKDSADYAGFRCPTWRGRRYWYLVAGPKATWADKGRAAWYVNRFAFEALDKLHQEYVMEWPGLQPPPGKDGKPVATPEAYADPSGRIGRRNRPFFGWGSVGGGSIGGDDHPLMALIRAQLYLDPDTFGDYWRYFSSENPNFATHWWSPVFTEAAKCKGHPRFNDLAKMVEMKLREDFYHSFTVPGGAGQECPGYMTLGTQHERTLFCKEHFGFDASQWPQYKAAGGFPIHASHPMPDGSRKSHPGGDTHPPGPDVVAVARQYGVTNDPATFVTEELPGFGAIFRNRPATPRETYFAFKSGPNRGHFHGDQLSFHYCAEGRPLAVDHHCSYAPRAGQEHMHNRVAFHTDKLPWANMDGYERLIAFKTSAAVDAAIGQVESERLRITTKFPPENWDTYLPEEVFDVPMKYRRTVVMVKDTSVTSDSPPAGAHSPWPDFFVIRDQHTGPDVYATYCLHVLGERCERRGQAFDFDGMRLFVARPADFTESRFDWEHEYGGKETTKGLRLTVKKTRESEFVTVLVPRPIKRSDVATLVLKGLLRESVDVDTTVRVAVENGKPAYREAHVALSPAEHRHLYAFRGTVQAGETDHTWRLTLDGSRGRFNYDRVKFEGTVRWTPGDGAQSGSYTGRVWDAAAMKSKEKGEAAPGRECGGALAVTLERDVVPPVPLFDPTWQPPAVEALPDGVKVGDTVVRFAGGIGDEDATAYVTVTRGGQTLATVTGADVDMDRFQGQIGLFVPDAGYPFGVLPDWLIRQRYKHPDWYRDLWPLAR
jgi:hypothetical protein